MNTSTRLGKIARLPHSIREQLNLKLHDNVPAKSILPWLNSLSETKAILAAHFDNRPVTKQNLSEWKQGGFRDWLLQFNAANFLQFLPSDVSRASSPASSDGFSPAEARKHRARRHGELAGGDACATPKYVSNRKGRCRECIRRHHRVRLLRRP